MPLHPSEKDAIIGSERTGKRRAGLGGVTADVQTLCRAIHHHPGQGSECPVAAIEAGGDVTPLFTGT